MRLTGAAGPLSNPDTQRTLVTLNPVTGTSTGTSTSTSTNGVCI